MAGCFHNFNQKWAFPAIRSKINFNGNKLTNQFSSEKPVAFPHGNKIHSCVQICGVQCVRYDGMVNGPLAHYLSNGIGQGDRTVFRQRIAEGDFCSTLLRWIAEETENLCVFYWGFGIRNTSSIGKTSTKTRCNGEVRRYCRQETIVVIVGISTG